jgi:hypothetical protein
MQTRVRQFERHYAMSATEMIELEAVKAKVAAKEREG